jgi:hypothetical protein
MGFSTCYAEFSQSSHNRLISHHYPQAASLPVDRLPQLINVWHSFVLIVSDDEHSIPLIMDLLLDDLLISAWIMIIIKFSFLTQLLKSHEETVRDILRA